jgi:ribosomal-protein-alanine N-acetyltransferase
MTKDRCAEEPPHPFSPTAPLPLDLNALGPAQALDQRALGGFWSPGQWQQELHRQGSLCLGQWQGEGLVSLASGWLVAGELQLTLVAVDPSWRRRGLGRQVLTTLLQEAQRQGCGQATLEVAESNRAAQGLYAGLGFSTVGIRRRYYRNGDAALIQWLKLNHLEEVRIPAPSFH